MTENAPSAKLSLYDRLKLATRHKWAEPILAALCFLEAMIIPVFPEVMLAPMIIADRLRAWRLATICTISSVSGGMAGYAIGFFLFESIGRAIIHFYGAGAEFESLRQSFVENGPLMIMIGAVTPIPYKVITITCGVAGVNVWTFLIFSLIGRGLRYFVPCGLFYFFGPAAGTLIERHKAKAAWIMIVAVIGGFAAAPLFFPKGHASVPDQTENHALVETTVPQS